ncbi:MAG TPA: hypothetical protein VJZ27_04045, partial [Aggregatilineales bacterium]|nr:hypothetical protein [Aggregatilineales bacterium]
MILLSVTACARDSDEIIQIPTLRQRETWTPSASPASTSEQRESWTPSASPSPFVSETPFPSLTRTLTPTPSQTASPIPTITPTPFAIHVEVISYPAAYVRRGPGVSYEVVDEVSFGENFGVIAYAVSAGGDVWYLIQLAGQRAWISSIVAEVESLTSGEELALAATIPPTFTPSPTPTITPTVTITPIPTLPIGANARVSGEFGLNLREGAGYRYGVRELLAIGEPLVLLGRTSDSQWFQAVTFGDDAKAGWVLGRLVDPVIDV